MDLGTLYLGFAADLDSYKKSLAEARRLAVETAKGIDKQLGQIQIKRNTIAIKVKLDTSELKNLSVKLNCQCDPKLKASPAKTDNSNLSGAIDKAANRIVKAVQDSTKIKIGNELKRGLFWGIGQSFSGGLANSKVGRRINQGQVQAIDKTTDYVSRRANAAWSTFAQSPGKINQKAGKFNKEISPYLQSIGIEVSGEENLKGLIESFQEIKSLGVDLFPSDLVLPNFKEVIKDAKILSNEIDKISKKIKDPVAMKNTSLEEVFMEAYGKTSTIRRVNTEGLKRRNKRKSIEAAKQIKSNYKHEQSTNYSSDASGQVFVVGGLAGMEGKHSLEIAPKIELAINDPSRQITPIENKFSDKGKPDIQLIANTIGNKVNKDSLALAEKAFAAHKANPNQKIDLIGYSAGGYNVQGAGEILKELGVPFSAYGVGTPDIGATRTLGKEYQSLSLQDDTVVNKALEKARLAGFKGQQDKVFPGKTHAIEEFLGRKESHEYLVSSVQGKQVSQPKNRAGISTYRGSDVRSYADEVYSSLEPILSVNTPKFAQKLLADIEEKMPSLVKITKKLPEDLRAETEEYIKALEDAQEILRQHIKVSSEPVKPKESAQKIKQEPVAAKNFVATPQQGQTELERAKHIAKQFRDAYKQIKDAIDQGDQQLASQLASQIKGQADQARAEIASITKSLGENAAFGTDLGNKLANAKGQITKTVNLSNRAVAKEQKKGQGQGRIANDAVSIGQNIAAGLGQGTEQGIKDITAITQKMAEALIAAAEDILEIQSPSKVFAQIGQNVVKGLESGIKSAANIAKEAIKPIAAQLPEAAMEAVAQAQPIAPQSIFGNLIGGINEAVNTGLENLKQSLQKIPGGSLLAPLIDGFKEFKNAIVGAFLAFNTLQLLFTAIGRINEFSQAWIESAQVVESFELQYRFTAGSVEKGTKSFEFARSEAKRLGTDVKASLEGFVGLEASAKETPLQGEGTQQIFSAFSQGATVFDLTGEQQAGMFLGLKQMISQSRVGAEEMNQIAERMPGFWNMAARSMGMTVRQFRAASESGELLAEDVLPKIAQQLSAETSGSVTASANSSVSAITKFNNATFEMQAALGKAFLPLKNTGLNILSSLLGFVTKNIDVFRKALEFASFAVYVLIAKNIKLLIESLTKIPGVAGIATKALEMLAKGSGFSQNKQKASDMITGVGQGIQSFKASPVQSIGDMFQGMGGAAKGKATAVFDGMKASVAGIGQSLMGLKANAGVTFASMIGGVKAFGLAAVTNGVAGVMTLIGGIRALLASLGPVLLLFLAFEAVTRIWDQIQFATKDAGGATREFANAAADGLKKYQQSVNDALGSTEKLAVSQKKLGFWGNLKRNLIDNPRMGLANGLEGIGLGKVARFIRPRDETTRRDTLKAMDESMSTGRKLVAETTSAQTSKIVGDLKEIDKQLASIGVKRRGSLVTNPGDKSAIRKLDEDQAALLQRRAKLVQPTGILSQQLQAQVEGYKAQLEELNRLNEKWRNNEIGGIDPETYAKRTAEVKAELERTQAASESFTKSIGEAINAFALLQKNIKAVADELADAGDRTTISTNQAKAALAQQRATGEITAGEAQFRGAEIDQADQSTRIAELEKAIKTQQGLLSTKEAQDTLAAYGVDNNIGQARLKTISESAQGNDKFYLESFANIKQQEIDLSGMQSQLAQARADVQQQMIDLNKQVEDYYKGIERQSKELEIQAKQAAVQIEYQSQANKLKSALLGVQDNIVSQFVDSLIEAAGKTADASTAALDAQSKILSNQFQFEDTVRSGVELSRSLPGKMPKIPVELDFAGVPNNTDLGKLDQQVQNAVGSTRDLNSATSMYRRTVDEAESGLQGNVNVSQSLQQEIQSNVQTSQELNAQFIANSGELQNNANIVTSIDASVGGVVDTTGQLIGKAGELSGVMGTVDQSTQGYGQSLAAVGSVFDQLIAKAQELAQQTQVAATAAAASSMGAGAFAPGVAVAMDAAMGQVMSGGGASLSKDGSGKVTENYRTGTLAAQEYGAPRPGRKHAGQDIDVSGNQQAQSFIGGIVTRVVHATNGKGYGSYVDVFNKQLGVVERIAEVMRVDVKEGQTIKPGQAIGGGESRTGVFHYEIRKPVDAKGRGGFTYEGTQDPIKFYEKLGIAKRQGQQIKILSGLNAGQTLNAAEHHVGDGHNHFGEDDLKAANKKQASAIASSPTSGGSGGAPKLGQGYDALNILGGQLSQNKYFNPSTPEGKGRLAIALGIGGSEAFEKNSTRRGFYDYRGGTGNNMQGFGQFNRKYHANLIDTPEKYQNFFGQTLSGERRLPNSQKGIGDYGAKVMQAVQSGQIQSGSDLIRWMQANKLGGSNWQGVDDGWKRNPGLADQLVQYMKGGLPTQKSGSAPAMPTGVAAPIAQAQQMAITGSKLPPVTYNPRGVSGAAMQSRTAGAMGLAQQNTQTQNNIAVQQARQQAETANIEGLKQRENAFRQLQTALRESGVKTQGAVNQVRDTNLETGGEQTPQKQQQSRLNSLTRQYDDMVRELQDQRRDLGARIQTAQAALADDSKLLDPEARAALQQSLSQSQTELKKIDGALGQAAKGREDAMKFANESFDREEQLRRSGATRDVKKAQMGELQTQLEMARNATQINPGDLSKGDPVKLQSQLNSLQKQLELEEQIQQIQEQKRKGEKPGDLADQEIAQLQKNLKLEEQLTSEVERRALAERELAIARRQFEEESRRVESLNAVSEAKVKAIELGREQGDPIAVRNEIEQRNQGLALKRQQLEAKETAFQQGIPTDQLQATLTEQQKLAEANQANLAAQFEREKQAREAQLAGMMNEVQSALVEAQLKASEFGLSDIDPLKTRYDSQVMAQQFGSQQKITEITQQAQALGVSKEEVDKLVAAYQRLDSVTLGNLKAEYERSVQDRQMAVDAQTINSDISVLQAQSQGLSQRGLGFQAKQLDKQIAVKQQGLSFQQQSVELERFIQQNNVAADAAARLRGNLEQVNNVTLDNIQAQFDPMTEVLNGVQGSFKTFFSDLISGSKSFEDAFKGLVDSIVGNLANMAAEWLTNEMFGQLFGKKGEGIGSTGGFAAAPQQPSANNIVPFGSGSTFSTLGTTPMQPMYVQDIAAQTAMGGFTGATMGGFPSLFGGSPDIGRSFADSLFGSGETLPVNILGANDSFFSSMSDGLGGVLGNVFSMFGGGGGGGIGSAVSSIMGLFGGGGGGGGGMGGGLGGIAGFAMNLLGFAKGGKVLNLARGGCTCPGICGYHKGGKVLNYASGGMVQHFADAIAREKSMNGGRAAVPAVLTVGERVLTVEQNKRFEALGGERILNMAMGGTVKGGGFAQSVADSSQKAVSINSPITIQTEGGSDVDAPRFRAVHEAMTRRLIQQELKPGGSLRGKR